MNIDQIAKDAAVATVTEWLQAWRDKPGQANPRFIQSAIEKATKVKDEAIERLHNRVNYVRACCPEAESLFTDWAYNT